MRYQFVKQEGIKDCGVSCLLMIIRTYKGGCSKEYLRNLTHTTKDGTTAYDLLMAGNHFNFTTFALKGNVDKLEEKYFPVIAHVIKEEVYQHFIVIYQMNLVKKELLIADPASGIKKMSFDEFQKITTNQFLIFLPNTPILKIDNKHPIPELIKNFLKNKNKVLAKIILLSFLYTAISIILTLYFQILLSQIETSIHNTFLLSYFIFFTILTILKILIQYIRIHFLINLTNDFDSYLQQDVYHHLLSLPDSYFKNRTTGEVLARITDLYNLKDMISKFLLNICLDSLLTVIAFIILWKINMYLTYLLLAFTILNICIFMIFKNKLKWRIIDTKESYAKTQSFLTDSLSNVFSMRHLDREPYIEDKFKNVHASYLERFKKYQKLNNLEMLWKNFFHEFLQLLLITLGCILIGKYKISTIEFMTYIFLSSFFLEPLESIYEFLFAFQEQKEVIERIKEFYLVKKDLPKKDRHKKKINSIKLENITFFYGKKDRILNKINMNFTIGEKVLIYGKSGSGKSTLMKILAGYIEEYEGNIYLNEDILKEDRKQILQKNITYISQEEELLNMSIKENIILGRSIPMEKFQQITNILHIDDFVSKNVLTYNTIIEENGRNLSGGERQRIIIARSLLRESDVYIFDESLCNMDISLERKILENIFEYLKEKTVIVISHRFYNMDLYNRKIKLQKGEIYEEN